VLLERARATRCVMGQEIGSLTPVKSIVLRGSVNSISRVHVQDNKSTHGFGRLVFLYNESS
jgi:hypothetical protein